MAVKWNKIYRGGVHRTTPETREANAPTTGELLPGTAVNVTTAAGGMTVAKGARSGYFYVVGEQMHGSVDDDQVQTDAMKQSSIRMYIPHSGDLLAGRAVAGISVLDDTPLTIDTAGRFKVAAAAAGETPADPIYAYIDNPASAHPGTSPATTVLDQLIPIKIK